MRRLQSDTLAAHIFGAMVLGWVLAQEEEADPPKVIEMLLLHDLVMAKMEDVTPDSKKYVRKSQMEGQVSKLIGKILRKTAAKRYLDLFKQFQEKSTKEARVAHDADRLETLLQAQSFEEETGKSDILDQFLETYQKVIQTSSGKRIFNEIKSRHERRQKALPSEQKDRKTKAPQHGCD